MADSRTASDSMTASLENGFDPPDVPSTKVSTENKDGEGDVSGTSKKDAEEKKSPVEEVKGVVVEEKGLEDSNYGVDMKDLKEVKDVENEKNVVVINVNVDENKDLVSTKDSEEKKDERDITDLEDSEQGEEREDSRETRQTNENKGVVENMHLEGLNDTNGAEGGEEKKGAGEPDEMERKSDVVETQIDVKEAQVVEKNMDAVKALDGEKEKVFGETKDEEGKKVIEEIKHDEDRIVVEEKMNAEENDVADLMEDIGGKNNVQSSGNVEDNGGKNYVSDAKSSEQKQVVEGKLHGDDSVVEQLKYGRSKQIVQGTADDEKKRDLDVEYDAKNNLKPLVGDERAKVKKKAKNTGKVEATVGKKVIVDVRVEEPVGISGLEDAKEDIAEGVHISEEEDVAAEEDDDGDIEKKSSNKKVATSFKRKRGGGQRSSDKGVVKDNNKSKGKKDGGKKAKELSDTFDLVSSPIGSSRERPVRERKTVERLVEVIEKEPNKSVIIEKGRGTPLKDIPNVAYKLARKKPADLKFLHQTLFGRRGKVVDFKSNILQFSGFAWHEAEEKQRAKIKEKLDKCVKDNLLDLCDLLDLTVSKTSTKKEEIIVKLLDFLEAPHATTDIMLVDREQSEKSRKRKRFPEVSGSRSSGGTLAKRSRKKSAKAEGTPKSSGKTSRDTEDEDKEEDTENGVPDEDDAPGNSESDAKENALSGASDDEGENEDNDEVVKVKKDMELSPKKRSSANVEKRKTGSSSKKVSSETQVKSPVKTPSSYKHLKVKRNDTGEKVFTRKKKKGSESPEASDDEGENENNDELGTTNQDIKQSPKRCSSSISKKKKRMGSKSKKTSSQTVVKSPVKTPSSHKQAKVEKDDAGEKVFTRKKKDGDSTKKSHSKLSAKDNSSGKKSGKGKITGEERKSGPTKTDLRKTICKILKEVDFNTATFTDILRKLAAHYKMDLTTKKASIKQMIEEELTKIADEAEDSEDGEKQETPKEENPKPAGKKVKA